LFSIFFLGREMTASPLVRLVTTTAATAANPSNATKTPASTNFHTYYHDNFSIPNDSAHQTSRSDHSAHLTEDYAHLNSQSENVPQTQTEDSAHQKTRTEDPVHSAHQKIRTEDLIQSLHKKNRTDNLIETIHKKSQEPILSGQDEPVQQSKLVKSSLEVRDTDRVTLTTPQSVRLITRRQTDSDSEKCEQFSVGEPEKQEFYSPNYDKEYENHLNCVRTLEGKSRSVLLSLLIGR